MMHAHALFALLPLWTATVQDAGALDAARLVPADAILAVRVESAEQLHGLATRFARLSGEELPGDVVTMLGDMDVPGDSSQIDTKRPAYFALSLAAGSAAPTFVVPVRDAQAYSTSLGGLEGFQFAVQGGYVGVSQKPGYAAGAQASALVSALRPGLISMRVDLASLIRTYRPLIEMGLGQFEMMMDEMSLEEDAAMDMTALMEVYFDGIWAFVDSADQLDLVFDYDGKVAQKRVWLATLDGSPMAKMGGTQAYDLRPGVGLLDPEAGFGMLMACDMAATMERFGPAIDAVLGAYPAEMGGELRRMLDAYRPVLPLVGPLIAASGDFGESGMRVSYHVSSKQADQLSEAMRAALASLASGEAGKTFGFAAPQEVELGGARALRSRVTLDAESLMQAAGAMEGVEGVEMEQMQSMLRMLYGADGLQIVWRPQGDRVALAAGGDDAYATNVLSSSPRAFSSLPAELRSAVESASGGSLGLVYRIDYARILGGMAPLFAGMGVEELGLFADSDLRLPLTLWMSVAGTTWTGGAGLDMDQLEAFVAAIRSVEEAQDAVPDEEER